MKIFLVMDNNGKKHRIEASNVDLVEGCLILGDGVTVFYAFSKGCWRTLELEKVLKDDT